MIIDKRNKYHIIAYLDPYDDLYEAHYDFENYLNKLCYIKHLKYTGTYGMGWNDDYDGWGDNSLTCRFMGALLYDDAEYYDNLDNKIVDYFE